MTGPMKACGQREICSQFFEYNADEQSLKCCRGALCNPICGNGSMTRALPNAGLEILNSTDVPGTVSSLRFRVCSQ